jgi:pimeloyl-ACP methyl ester carboxylesterase
VKRLSTWHLIHGFNRDPDIFAGLQHDLGAAGMRSHVVDYGHQITLSTRSAVKAILKECPHGCNIIAHSNGAIAAWIASLEHGLWIRKLIMVNPPMARDARVPPMIGKAWCVWNQGDKTVSWSRRYNALIDALLPWERQSHQLYGDMGRYGPLPNTNIIPIQTSRLYGHSGIFKRPESRAVIVDLVR